MPQPTHGTGPDPSQKKGQLQHRNTTSSSKKSTDAKKIAKKIELSRLRIALEIIEANLIAKGRERKREEIKKNVTIARDEQRRKEREREREMEMVGSTRSASADAGGNSDMEKKKRRRGGVKSIGGIIGGAGGNMSSDIEKKNKKSSSKK
ncbi:hypothetical protein EAF04_009342 [Stromatinia cepivora]|nr:hypothetical protein EAF04_009342 [Stromatinia cepivora]